MEKYNTETGDTVQDEFTGKYWPRLFMPELMRAIKKGIKTQTRRPLTWKNTWFDGGPWPKWAKRDLSIWDWKNACVSMDEGRIWISPISHIVPMEADLVHFIEPRVQVGDVFWTKETHAYSTVVSSTAQGVKFGDPNVIYRADCDATMDKIITGNWRPSIFQKKEHTRFHLPITGVRIEQTQSISEADAKEEGVLETCDLCGNRPEILEEAECHWICESDYDPKVSYKIGFQRVWDSLYGGGPGKWEDNWWVIAYNFDIKEVTR